jgi:hypothetical protein
MVFIRWKAKKKTTLPMHILHQQRIRYVVGAMSCFATAAVTIASGMLQMKVPYLNPHPQ